MGMPMTRRWRRGLELTLVLLPVVAVAWWFWPRPIPTAAEGLGPALEYPGMIVRMNV